MIDFVLLMLVASARAPQIYEVHEVWDQPPPAETVAVPDMWQRLADCESGAWIDGGRDFVYGSARWDADEGLFEGGLQFHPDTWDWLRPDYYPDSAADATPQQQIFVAERVREVQGLDAWPRCSELALGVGR